MGVAAPKPPLAIPPHSKLWGFLAFSRELSEAPCYSSTSEPEAIPQAEITNGMSNRKKSFRMSEAYPATLRKDVVQNTIRFRFKIHWRISPTRSVFLPRRNDSLGLKVIG